MRYIRLMVMLTSLALITLVSNGCKFVLNENHYHYDSKKDPVTTTQPTLDSIIEDLQNG